jgi:hypothetical protein
MKWMFLHGRVIWNWPTSLDDYHQDIYGTKIFKRNTLDMAFENYHKEVRKYFKYRSEDFLEIQIEDGFDINKICDFLQIAYRPIQVIHSNKGRSAKNIQIIKYYIKRFALYPLKKLFKNF